MLPQGIKFHRNRRKRAPDGTVKFRISSGKTRHCGVSPATAFQAAHGRYPAPHEATPPKLGTDATQVGQCSGPGIRLFSWRTWAAMAVVAEDSGREARMEG